MRAKLLTHIVNYMTLGHLKGASVLGYVGQHLNTRISTQMVMLVLWSTPA